MPGASKVKKQQTLFERYSKKNTKQIDDNDLNIFNTLKRVEKELFDKAMHKFTNTAAASKALGISEKTFYRRLKEYKII